MGRDIPNIRIHPKPDIYPNRTDKMETMNKSNVLRRCSSRRRNNENNGTNPIAGNKHMEKST